MTTIEEILYILGKESSTSSRELFDKLEAKVSYATLKRNLKILTSEELIFTTGKGKATKYSISKGYKILKDISLEDYFTKEIDERNINDRFIFTLIENDLKQLSLFNEAELTFLKSLQKEFEDNVSKLSKNEYDSELERLAIDLSWKSSQIEGNTYSLLETERLLKEKETTSGKTKDEAVMLLNHKDALTFIIETPHFIEPLNLARIEDIHRLLTKELGIDSKVRRSRVGISGTNYRPLDNEFQIREALIEMCNLVNSKDNVFEKSFLVLILISYIQGFADGNKRTARIISNAILIKNNYCPISFRTVDSIDYKKAMLIFYEQNNISAFKKIFIDQFEFAVKTYF